MFCVGINLSSYTMGVSLQCLSPLAADFDKNVYKSKSAYKNNLCQSKTS